MTIRFHNTETRRLEEFHPLEPGKVRMYTCGPTVYNFAHIGNIRTFAFEDLLRRFLKFMGFSVTQVMNITDIEDKILRDYKASGLGFRGFTDKYMGHFFEDLSTLGIERAEHYPRATDHVPEMISIVSALLEKGHAYKAEDGSVYFKVDSCPNYGRLVTIDRSALKAGARAKVDEYTKDDAQDFALWKAWDEADGEVFWDAPFGKGRPGWHIECSAMAMKYLGETFDIHTGGVDNIFPHHENEIAQSECATGKTFSRYWLHSEHLLVEGKKMSKSLGNFYTLRDLLAKGYAPLAIRYLLLSTHYRAQLNFTFGGLEAAAASSQRLNDFRARLDEPRAQGPADPAWVERLEAARAKFTESLCDDLNVSPALAALFDLMGEANRRDAAGALTAGDAKATADLLDRCDAVFGFLKKSGDDLPAAVTALVAERAEAKKRRDFARADAIRGELAALGYAVEDTPKGPRVKHLGRD